MKTIILFAVLLTMTLPLSAQQINDSSAMRQQRKHQRSGFVDENGDGMRDRKMKGQTDRFIDSNGDGICDSREHGLGFRRGANQSGNQYGKKQQGRKK